jgi:non-ribosomal peptide synthetase component F
LPQRFGEPDGRPDPRYRKASFLSPATLLAVRAAAARAGIDTSPVLLAAFAIALARITGNNPVVTMLAVSNRFRPGLAGIVSPIAQISPCVIDVADVTFAEAVARAGRAAMTAYKNAYYDPTLRVAVIAAVNRERGTEVDLSCFFNDRRQQGRAQPGGPVPTAGEIRQALPHSRFRWDDDPELPMQKLYLHVNDAAEAVELTLSADTRYLPPATIEAILRGIESVLVEGALYPAAPTGVRLTAAPA